jgi:transcriptional regulator of arginine metabolism
MVGSPNMQNDRSRRHQAILDIIRGDIVSSQKELRERLDRSGFHVTQATLSRDLRELGVVKRPTRRGMYRYSAPDPSDPAGILSCRVGGPLLVMKTEMGLAPRVAYRIDALGLPEVLGTVAGEDTLLVVSSLDYSPEKVRRRIIEELEGGAGAMDDE